MTKVFLKFNQRGNLTPEWRLKNSSETLRVESAQRG